MRIRPFEYIWYKYGVYSIYSNQIAVLFDLFESIYANNSNRIYANRGLFDLFESILFDLFKSNICNLSPYLHICDLCEFSRFMRIYSIYTNIYSQKSNNLWEYMRIHRIRSHIFAYIHIYLRWGAFTLKKFTS